MPDTSHVDDQTDAPFTTSQFEAARFMVARLRAEAAGEKFQPEDIGMKFSPLGDAPTATVDGEMVISSMDFIRASLLLLWSMVMDAAESMGEDPGTIVTALGVSLAEHDPA